MHRYAGRFPDRHQARHHAVRVVVLGLHHFAVVVAGNAAHVVVHGRLHRDRLLGDIHAGKDARGLGDARQALVDDGGAEVFEVQIDVVMLAADAAPLADLHRHGAADDVARSEILGVRRVALHEALALGIGEVAALAARPFGDQAAGAIDAGRMELHELHVLQRQAGTQHHGITVAGARVRRGAGEVGTTVAAGGEDRHVRAETVQRPLGEVERQHAAAHAVLHDEVDREVLDEEGGGVADRLLVERVQHRMPGAVGRRAGALRDALAVVGGHTAEGALVDAASVGARERHAVMLQLDDRGRCLLAHELDGVLVAQPVRPLDGVVHVPAPVVLTHVAERGADAALRRHGVAAGRKELGDAGGRQAALGQSERGTQAGAACAHDDHVVAVVGDRVSAHGGLPSATRSTAKRPAAAMNTCRKVTSTSSSVRLPAPCT